MGKYLYNKQVHNLFCEYVNFKETSNARGWKSNELILETSTMAYFTDLRESGVIDNVTKDDISILWRILPYNDPEKKYFIRELESTKLGNNITCKPGKSGLSRVANFAHPREGLNNAYDFYKYRLKKSEEENADAKVLIEKIQFTEEDLNNVISRHHKNELGIGKFRDTALSVLEEREIKCE